MNADHHADGTGQHPLRCGPCGDAIGVYEPLVYLDDQGSPVLTSLLRLPDEVRDRIGETTFFHAACHPGSRSG